MALSPEAQAAILERETRIPEATDGTCRELMHAVQACLDRHAEYVSNLPGLSILAPSAGGLMGSPSEPPQAVRPRAMPSTMAQVIIFFSKVAKLFSSAN